MFKNSTKLKTVKFVQNYSCVLNKLCSPISHQALHMDGEILISSDRVHQYSITEKGIPLFAQSFLTENAERQRDHYDRVAIKYVENLGYPHTEEYMKYLDRVFLEQVELSDSSAVAEICCGHGEFLSMFQKKFSVGIGVDISKSMLEIACDKHYIFNNFIFVQGDATNLPLQDSQFDSVFIFGGIHHIPDRKVLFDEIFRILKPGGRFYFREPVSDFFVWRWIRALIYNISPALDARTERPLLWLETVPILEGVGFKLLSWKTYGFLGFCFFMNSDVLIFNRLFRFISGIRLITRLAAYLDDILVKLPGFGRAGLQVVGIVEKPF